MDGLVEDEKMSQYLDEHWHRKAVESRGGRGSTSKENWLVEALLSRAIHRDIATVGCPQVQLGMNRISIVTDIGLLVGPLADFQPATDAGFGAGFEKLTALLSPCLSKCYLGVSLKSRERQHTISVCLPHLLSLF